MNGYNGGYRYPLTRVVSELQADARNSIGEIARRRPEMNVSELVDLFASVKPIPPLREPLRQRKPAVEVLREKGMPARPAAPVDWSKTGSGVNPFGPMRDRRRRIHQWLLSLGEPK
jgi:hypothetical protein